MQINQWSGRHAGGNGVGFSTARLECLQAGRALAAILVVLFHTSTSIFALPKYWNAEPFGRFFDFGDSGVYFFFVLSGFIIMHAHRADLGCPERLRSYAWKRFRRIYPFYWLVLLLLLPVYLYVPAFGKGFETRPDIIVTSFLLVHLTSPEAVILVSWTLFHEVLFYALFGVAIWWSRFGAVLICSWMLLSVLSLATNRDNLLTGFYLSPMHLLFGLGLAASWWLERDAVPYPAWIAAAGTAAFAFSGLEKVLWHDISGDWLTLCFGLGATMLVLGAVELERAGRLTTPSWLRLLGDASYSIYLTHFFALSLMAKLAWRTGLAGILPTGLAYLVLASLAVLTGTLAHLWLERPLLGLFKQRPPALDRVSENFTE